MLNPNESATFSNSFTATDSVWNGSIKQNACPYFPLIAPRHVMAGPGGGEF